jgi:hypothetical protein
MMRNSARPTNPHALDRSEDRMDHLRVDLIAEAHPYLARKIDD